MLTAFEITDITVKANDPKTLWISFDGFETQWDNERVIVSHDFGNTWSNYSDGLPNFPINCLRYMKGTPDRLFVGTDVGVFTIDSTLTEWQPFNTGLPVCVVYDLEINDNIKEIRAGTYGRGIWESTLSCDYYPNSPIEITRNTTWTADTALNTNLFIDSSFTLTLLRNTVKMPPLAKIYIKQGGKLIVNGATITNKCANMWQGIEVWGRKDKPQNSRYQGWITLENGALIENARIGITTSNSTSNDFWTTSGGIISAQSSTFRNNYKAVEFYYNDYGQHSVFTKVNFETTGPFIDGTSTPSDFVSMLSTTGVSFYGCNFRNTTIDTSSVPLPVAGRGIYSVNSTYTVDQYYYCPSQLVPCPNPVITPSSFSGLYYGIRAINTNPLSLFSVNNTNFEKNFRGIYASEMSQPQITLCNFTIPHQSPKVDTIYGLYLGKSTGYKVQENFFRSPGNVLLISNLTPFACRTIGIIVDSSGTRPNEIYKNTFQTIDIGINAQRLNKSTSSDSSGLVLKCNKYNNNSYDETVASRLPNNGEGIAPKQGAKTSDKKDAAGNTFSPFHSQYAVNESDIKNQGDNLIYFHHIQGQNVGDPRFRPDYSTPLPSVKKSDVGLSYDTVTCCLSKLTTVGGLPMLMSAQLSLEQTKVDSLTTVLNSVVDGGNTDGLNATVFFSQPCDAIQVRQDLLNQSPYLSDTVMKTAIDKENVLPNEMVRDVLVANPQSATSDNVLNELNTRFIPMPDSLLGEIMNGQVSLSDKEAIEANLSLHNLNLQYAFDELVRYYKTDTINPQASHDSLMILLAREQNPVAQYMLAFEYYYLGDWKNVNSVLNNMSNNLHFSTAETKQHQDYLKYFSFLKSLSDQGRTIYQLSTGDIDTIQLLIVSASEPVKSYAQNILEANNLLKYYEPILLPEDLKSAPDKKSIKTAPFSRNDWLRIFPNPARQYVIVEYNLADKISTQQAQIVFSVSTLDGKRIETRLLSKPQDQFLVNTTNYSPGVFLFTIQLSGKTVSTKKVTITN